MGSQRVHGVESTPRRKRRKAPARAEREPGLIALQRSAGNAAVTQALSVQRSPAPAAARQEDLGGIGARFAVDQYVGVAHKLQQNWGRLTPFGRAKVLVNAVNFELAHIDVPPVELKMENLDHDAGRFDSESWAMEIDRPHFAGAKIDDGAAAENASTIYHEARHAEQDFLVGRMLAGKKMKAAEIAEKFDMRVDVAAAAAKQPLTGAGEDRRRASKFYESEVGKHADERSTTLDDLHLFDERVAALQAAWLQASSPEEDKKAKEKLDIEVAARDAAYAAYRALPEEADAWEVGDAVKKAYSKSKQP